MLEPEALRSLDEEVVADEPPDRSDPSSGWDGVQATGLQFGASDDPADELSEPASDEPIWAEATLDSSPW